MPLVIITKNTPQRLTFDLSKGCTGLKLGTLDQPGVPDTHKEKSASGLIAFRNYWRKDSFPPFLRLNFTDCVFGSFFWPWEKSPKSCVQKLKIRSCQTLYSLRPFGQSGSFGGTTFLQVAGVWIFHLSFGVPRRAERRGYISMSYKMLTLFVRFMLWDSRKMKKNMKTAVSLLNAHKNRDK